MLGIVEYHSSASIAGDALAKPDFLKVALLSISKLCLNSTYRVQYALYLGSICRARKGLLFCVPKDAQRGWESWDQMNTVNRQ